VLELRHVIRPQSDGLAVAPVCGLQLRHLGIQHALAVSTHQRLVRDKVLHHGQRGGVALPQEPRGEVVVTVAKRVHVGHVDVSRLSGSGVRGEGRGRLVAGRRRVDVSVRALHSLFC